MRMLAKISYRFVPQQKRLLLSLSNMYKYIFVQICCNIWCLIKVILKFKLDTMIFIRTYLFTHLFFHISYLVIDINTKICSSFFA